MPENKIVLASASPRRIQMMKDHGYEPVIIKSDYKEVLPAGIGGEDAVRFLALMKALSVENMLREGRADGLAKGGTALFEESPYIVAADTIVYFDEIMGKPKDKEDCRKMLKKLEGKTHYVMSGVAILKAGDTVRTAFAEVSEVKFKTYYEADFESYLDSEEPYDKAGGYAIQGHFARYIESVVGDYDNIVGFPWKRFEKEFGLFLNPNNLKPKNSRKN